MLYNIGANRKRAEHLEYFGIYKIPGKPIYPKFEYSNSPHLCRNHTCSEWNRSSSPTHDIHEINFSAVKFIRGEFTTARVTKRALIKISWTPSLAGGTCGTAFVSVQPQHPTRLPSNHRTSPSRNKIGTITYSILGT